MSSIWFKNFPAGRFANAVYQYQFLQYLKIKKNWNIYIGDDTEPESYIAQELLEFEYNYLDLPSERTKNKKIFLGSDRSESPQKLVTEIQKSIETNPESIIEIDGYFQFNTLHFNPKTDYGKLFDFNFLPDNYGLKFQRELVRASRIYNEFFLDKYIIGIHVRRGDYLIHEANDNPITNPFYSLDLDVICEKIKEFIQKNQIKNFNIFVASDDLDYCVAKFNSNGLDILTSKDIFLGESVESRILVNDISGLMLADYLICSNSSLSILSALLNRKKGTQFIRFDKSQDSIGFNPFNTTILYGIS